MQINWHMTWQDIFFDFLGNFSNILEHYIGPVLGQILGGNPGQHCVKDAVKKIEFW